MQSYTKLVNAGLNKKPLKKYEIGVQQFANLHDRIVDLYNLVAFVDNPVLNDKRIVSDMFLNNKFLERTLVIGTDRFANCLRSVPQIKDIKDGQTIIVPPSPADNSVAIKSYQYTRRGNIVTEYSILHTIRQSATMTNPNWSLENLANSEDAKVENGKVYFKLNIGGQSRVATAFTDEAGKVCAVPYDDREHPFDTKHVLLFDAQGNELPIKGQDFLSLMNNLRNSVAHHRVYNFAPGTIYQGKLFKFNDGKYLLCSTSWFARFFPENQRAMYGSDNKFKYFYVSQGAAPVRNNAALEDKFNNECFTAEIYTSDCQMKKEIIDGIVDTAFKMYRSAQSSYKGTAEQFLTEYIGKYLTNFKVKVSTDVDYSMLSSRIVPAADPAASQKFFSIFSNAKENRAAQNNLIDYLVNNIYGVQITPSRSETSNGKFAEIPLDLRKLSDVFDDNIYAAHCCAGGSTYRPIIFVANPERYIGLCVMGIYSSLICNNLYDRLNDIYIKYKQRMVLTNADMQLFYGLGALDMSMFDINSVSLSRKNTTKPSSPEDKFIVLKAMRNAICHNSVAVKLNRSGDFKQNNIIFYDKKSRCNVVVQQQKLVEFLSQPFFDWGCGSTKLLQSQTKTQLLAEIKQLNGTNIHQCSEDDNSWI